MIFAKVENTTKVAVIVVIVTPMEVNHATPIMENVPAKKDSGEKNVIRQVWIFFKVKLFTLLKFVFSKQTLTKLAVFDTMQIINSSHNFEIFFPGL